VLVPHHPAAALLLRAHNEHQFRPTGSNCAEDAQNPWGGILSIFETIASSRTSRLEILAFCPSGHRERAANQANSAQPAGQNA
jgi:hypothetical protein